MGDGGECRPTLGDRGDGGVREVDCKGDRCRKRLRRLRRMNWRERERDTGEKEAGQPVELQRVSDDRPVFPLCPLSLTSGVFSQLLSTFHDFVTTGLHAGSSTPGEARFPFI